MSRLLKLISAVTLSLLFAGNPSVKAQTSGTPNAAIVEAYGSYLPKITPKQMDWLNGQLSRSIVKQANRQAGEQLPLLSSVPVMNKFVPGLQRDDFSQQPLQINPLKYMINFMKDEDQTFRIDGTDYVLFVKGLK